MRMFLVCSMTVTVVLRMILIDRLISWPTKG